MSDFFVMLVLKTVICKSKLLDFQNFASLELEHYESDSRHYGQTLFNQFKIFKLFNFSIVKLPEI